MNEPGNLQSSHQTGPKMRIGDFGIEQGSVVPLKFMHKEVPK
jgi:hypothetical protein